MKLRERGGRLICEFCDRCFDRDKDYSIMCRECSKSLRRFERESGSGDTFDVLVWAARRAREFAKKAL